ncbi:MAG: sulfotransferase [Porticoccaceae bacterium]
MTETNQTKPIFLLSLPRSGSTLLQRILTASSEIDSASEPWILLPYIYTMKKSGMATEFGHSNAVEAIKDFYSSFPNGEADYREAIRDFVLDLYGKSKGEGKYFLDKTPRYSVISKEIVKMFPDGKFIILWRSPLSIISSALITWKNGKWGVSHIEVDLYDGLHCMASVCREHQDKVFSLKYEDLVLEPEKYLRGVFEYLGLEWDVEVLSGFNDVIFDGMGDQNGVREYDKISAGSSAKWKEVLANPLRKWWCRRYLRSLGEDDMRLMGYDLDGLIKELNEIPFSFKYLFGDMIRMPYGKLNSIFNISLFRERRSQKKRGLSSHALH